MTDAVGCTSRGAVKRREVEEEGVKAQVGRMGRKGKVAILCQQRSLASMAERTRAFSAPQTPQRLVHVSSTSRLVSIRSRVGGRCDGNCDAQRAIPSLHH